MIKYHFNEDIFQTIDTPEKAYWLGFMYADGYIQEDKYAFGCALNQRDKNHLNKFLSFLEMPKFEQEECIKFQASSNSYRIILGRKTFVFSLIDLGFTSNKSYDKTSNVWDNIPKEYKKDFLLGLWDGDGSFFIGSDGKQKVSLISNNDILIKDIKEYIDEALGADFMNLKPRTDGDPYPRLRASTNKAKIFGDWLYSEKYPFVLDRKYNKYKQFHEIRGKGHSGFGNKRTKGVLCLDTGRKYTTAKECAFKELGKTNPGVISGIGATCRGERGSYYGKHFRYLTNEEREEMKNEKL